MYICWWCSRKLELPFFAEVKDLDGNVLRVHKSCQQAANRHFRPANFSQELPWEDRNA